jgi:hypothetical protein
MSGRIDYSISMTAIQDGTFDITYDQSQQTNVSNAEMDFIDTSIGKSLGGGKSNTTWGANSVGGWSSGTHTHITSNGSTGTDITVASGDDGLWIKHTGFKFDSGLSTTVEDTGKVIVYAIGGSAEVCRLSAGQAMFFPAPKDGAWKVKDDTGGEVIAVEYAILT